MSNHELILASASEARSTLLRRAGVTFRVEVSGVDEASIKQDALLNGESPTLIAARLAQAKADVILKQYPSALVLGCDQVLVLDDKLYDKPETMDEARANLKTFRNRSHTLISAAVLMKDGVEVWQCTDCATLTMRDFSDTFLETYLADEGLRLLSSVGAYRLEGLGSQLFADITGAHATILGLPLYPLLEELRNRGILQT